MTPNRLFFALFLTIFVAIATAIIISRTQKAPLEDVKTFEDCVRLGYPVMESYPRQCTLPNGKFFVEQLVESQSLPKNIKAQ